MRFLPFALVIAGIIANASAVRAYTVVGYGAQTCGKWTQDRSQNGAALTEGWLLGFLSALNQSADHPGIDIFRDIDNAGLFAWMDNYCQVHPLVIIVDAATLLEQYLEHRKP